LRLKSGAPSVHHTGPRSPSARFASSTCLGASAGSESGRLTRSRRLASINCLINASRSSVESSGVDLRQSRPRTTRYRPSGVVGCAGLACVVVGHQCLLFGSARLLLAGSCHSVAQPSAVRIIWRTIDGAVDPLRMCCMIEANQPLPQLRNEKPGRAPNTQGRFLGTSRLDLGSSCHHERTLCCRCGAPCLVRIHRRRAGADHRGGRTLCVGLLLGVHSYSRFMAGSTPFRSAFPPIECGASVRAALCDGTAAFGLLC
jgi:hypothetical protein